MDKERDAFEAIRHLEHLLSIDENQPHVLLDLANLYERIGIHGEEAALSILKQLIIDYPEYAPAYYNVGVYYYRREVWQQAMLAFQEAIKWRADYVDAYYQLALIHYQLRHARDSHHFFGVVLQLDATHVGARFHLACLLLQGHRYQEAKALFLNLLSTYPNHFETWVNLSHCYLALGAIDEAELALQKAHALMPDDVQVLFNLGVIAQYQRAFDVAESFYRAVLDRCANDVAAHYNLACIYLEKTQLAQAKAQLRRILTIAPVCTPATYLLCALEGETRSPKEAPAAYVTMLFNQYAHYYDAHMQSLSYVLPERMLTLWQSLRAEHAERFDFNILDLGCGTGKLGVVFQSYAACLLGVDLSAAMLEKARQKHIYTQLYEDDIVHYLHQQAVTQSMDLVLAADVLVYFGELDAVFAGIARIMKARSFFIFNVEQLLVGEYQLQVSGRFAHSKQYIEETVMKQQLHIVLCHELVLRYRHQEPIMGWIYVIRSD